MRCCSEIKALLKSLSDANFLPIEEILYSIVWSPYKFVIEMLRILPKWNSNRIKFRSISLKFHWIHSFELVLVISMLKAICALSSTKNALFCEKTTKKNKFMRNCGLLVFRLDAVSILSMHSQTIRNSITPSQFAECTFSNFEINAYMSFEYTWHLYLHSVHLCCVFPSEWTWYFACIFRSARKLCIHKKYMLELLTFHISFNFPSSC